MSKVNDQKSFQTRNLTQKHQLPNYLDVGDDDTPVTNIGMDWSCGNVDYRLQKIKDLEGVSQSIILQKNQIMRDVNPSNFRSFKDELERLKELKIFWSDRLKAEREKGSDEKQFVVNPTIIWQLIWNSLSCFCLLEM